MQSLLSNMRSNDSTWEGKDLPSWTYCGQDTRQSVDRPPALSSATCSVSCYLLFRPSALAEDATSLSAFILWQKRPVVRESRGYLRQDCFSFQGSRRQGVAHRTDVLSRCSQPDAAVPHILGPGRVAFNKTMEYEYVATSSLCSGIFLPGSSGFF